MFDRCGPLAAWTRAWLAGRVGIDQVVDAVTGADAPHHVVGLAVEPVPLHDVLVAWRRAGVPVRVVLPAPGDVRGLPGPAPFRAAALDVGEACLGGGLGVVPEVIDYAPSSAPPTVRWHAFAVEPAPPDHQSLADAQYELTTAIRESASALAGVSAVGWTADLVDALHGARRAGERLNLPLGFPSRAVALVAQALRLAAVLDLAFADPIGSAVDRSGIAARTDALRPLVTAVRRALVAGYNADAN